ncbi:MAG: F0F1 ATP synthase subunit beta, partial [Corynebacterium camporealensis]|nr:F0F1 ATP synthase subunit beta [Corynebacterium camporealensis]
MTTALEEQNAQQAATAGRVVRVIGAVVDVEFPRGELPALYNALTVEVTLESVKKTVVLEVAQH